MLHLSRALPLLALVALVAAPADADARRRRRKKVGALAITCTVDGATIHIDGKKVGTTPAKQLVVPAGTRKLKVKKLGYLDFNRKLKVKAGKTIEIDADLLPFAGVLSITANVRKAKVYIDGKVVGTAPLEHELELGSRTIKVQARGHDPWTETVIAAAGNRYEFRIELGKSGTGSRVAAASEPGPDDLALELTPLAPPPGDGGDELALEMPGLESPGGGGAAGDGTELTLEELPGLGGDLQLTAPGANDPLELTALPPGATKRVEPAPVWYKRWYVITGGAVALATMIALPIAIVATGGGEDTGTGAKPIDKGWQPGIGEFDVTGIPSIIRWR